MSHWPANHLLYKCNAKFFNNTHALYVKLQLDNDKNMEQQAKNNIKTKKSHTNVCAMELGIATSGIHFG